jgi:SAM-dependent methyltransferase
VLQRLATKLRSRSQPPPGPATGHELRYWLSTGLGKGTYIYENYLRLFGVDAGSLAGKVVLDFGSGPLGGVLSVLGPAGVAGHAVDVLAGEYNDLRASPVPIEPVVDYRTALADDSCDVCFCTNALDHDPRPERVVGEIARLLKPGGLLYLHVHRRREDQLNKAHRFVVTEPIVRSWLRPYFDELWLRTDQDWPNDEPDLTMIYGCFSRRSP